MGLGAEFRERPSRLIGIEDDYTAFCFDEACGFIMKRMRENGAEGLRWRESAEAGNANEGELVEFLRGFK